PLAEVLLDLGRHVDRHGDVEPLARDPHRVVDRRQVLLRELHVHDWTDDLDDLPPLIESLSSSPRGGRYRSRPQNRHTRARALIVSAQYGHSRSSSRAGLEPSDDAPAPPAAAPSAAAAGAPRTRNRSTCSRIVSFSSMGRATLSMVVEPASAAVCTFSVPYPSTRPHIVCVRSAEPAS